MQLMLLRRATRFLFFLTRTLIKGIPSLSPFQRQISRLLASRAPTPGGKSGKDGGSRRLKGRHQYSSVDKRALKSKVFPAIPVDEEGNLTKDYEPDCPDVILDGCVEGVCGSPIFSVNAESVMIEGFLFRHGDVSFGTGSDGSSLTKNCILGGTDEVKVLSDENIVTSSISVTNNLFRGGRKHAISLTGNNNLVKDNVFIMIDQGVAMSGDRGHVIGNTFVTVNDDDAVLIEGDFAVASDNLFVSADSAIDIDGSHAIIKANRLIGCEDGFFSMATTSLFRTIS